ncbi:hydroxymethylglutaryl-CoA reductase, degradative [Enterococcus sp. AZ072]|uniref:hydroxymethylglutaryl-CoA reductase, degradative n=1 Tax=unclassified Enterococcus TaxID=2608891 RepID=UPI003D2BB8F8
MKEIVILSAVRTPIGKYKGSLSATSAVDLGAAAIKEAIKRARVSEAAVGQVFLGNVLQAGNGQNVARQSAVKAGVPYEVPATTINEVCGSGIKAIILAMQQIQLGEAEVVVAGGTENMSQAPKLTKYDFIDNDWQEPFSSMIYDGLTDAFSGRHMGLTAEKVSEVYQVSRQDQDDFAYASQQKAGKARSNGDFEMEIVPVTLADGTVFSIDEGIREETTLEKIASLKAAFKEDGVVTAGNASTLNDGASALVLASKSYAEMNNLPYLATIEGYSEVGIDPNIMGVAPVSAIEKLLEKQNMTQEAIDLFEINEAFAAASVAVQKELQLSEEKLNIRGGGIALGHPIGASGARIVTTLLHELIQEDKVRGIASLCVGGGIGLALMIRKNDEAVAQKKKFYQLTRAERLAQLAAEEKITAEEAAQLSEDTVLPEKIANNLIENQISEVAIPLGLARNFVINGQVKDIPMATEEPSVIAAASNAAKIIGEFGGIEAHVLERAMVGQIVLQEVSDPHYFQQWLREKEARIFEVAQQVYPSIYQRGGGLKDIQFRSFPEQGYVSIDLIVDVKDAMGANILNTILEGVAQEIRNEIPGVNVLFSILSNYATHSLVEAVCRLPIASIGQEIAENLASAATYAKLDPYRAATHNKGIMNGVEAVVLATGNDTRAVSAAVHAYAARTGSYQGLTDWAIEDDQLIGRLVLPMAIGTVGGATKVLPKAQLNLKLLGADSAVTLSEIIAAVGLAQNFAALKALVSEGIQKGHMALQSRSLAITAGAQENEIPQVVQLLRQAPQMNLAAAEKILTQLRAT